MIPRRPFGDRGDSVSIIGLGGFRLGQTSSASVRIVQEGIDAGVTFLDNAWEYHDGESDRRMGHAIADRCDSVFLMTKVCTHGRSAKVGLRQLDESLKRLRTDDLDLWQIHECAFYDDPDRHYRAGGVVEALASAKAAGKVRYVGFTGHKDPDIHLRMLSFGFPFDACQMPLNGFDAQVRSFQARVLPDLARRQIAAIGMKPLGGDSLKVLRQNVRIAERFVAMSAAERRAYEETLAPYAADGRFELYKTSAEHEGAVGREQHGFPSENEVAL